MNMRTLKMAVILVGMISVPMIGMDKQEETSETNSSLSRPLYVGLSAVTSALTSSATTYFVIDMATSSLWGHPILQSVSLAPDFASAVYRATIRASGIGGLLGLIVTGILCGQKNIYESACKKATCGKEFSLSYNAIDKGLKSGLLLGVATCFMSLPWSIRPAGLSRIIG